MDRNELNAGLARMQMQAQAEVLRAQHEHEEAQAVAHVRHLSSQLQDRLTRLTHLADDVTRAVSYAEEGETFRYAHGAFGGDTETVDTLLAAMGEAVQSLATLRARRAIVESKAEGAAEEMFRLVEQSERPGVEPVPMPVAHGQYL